MDAKIYPARLFHKVLLIFCKIPKILGVSFFLKKILNLIRSTVLSSIFLLPDLNKFALLNKFNEFFFFSSRLTITPLISAESKRSALTSFSKLPTKSIIKPAVLGIVQFFFCQRRFNPGNCLQKRMVIHWLIKIHHLCKSRASKPVSGLLVTIKIFGNSVCFKKISFLISLSSFS